MHNRYIFRLEKAKLPSEIGNKAEKLGFLIKNGFQTPRSWVCTWGAYLRYLEDEQEINDRLASELLERLDVGRSYAVRSSASIEDGLDHSFAGQFKTFLDVQGLEGMLQAIRSVWEATRSKAVRAYLGRNGLDAGDLKMAVIIQEMVHPVVSGVSFSKNPITGLDEVVVEAVKGSGEALVQDGVTPARWISKWGDWISKPADEEVEVGLIEEVVQQTRAIAQAYGEPVDLEWVYDGHALHWVQLRGITSLDVDIYSNRISKEMFPGIIKPLVWSVAVPLVNGEWVKLFTELIGPNDIDPNSLARSFGYRAYFNMGAVGRIFELLGLPRETLELLLGIEGGGSERPSFKPTAKTYRLLPRMVWFAVNKLRFAGKIEAFIQGMEKEYQSFDIDQVAGLDEGELIWEIEHLYALAQDVAYYNIVTPLLMQTYNALLKNRLARIGVDFESFDATAGLRELDDFDPNLHLGELNRMYNSLEPDVRACIRSCSYEELREVPGAEALRSHVEQFIERFGHLSDSGTDFSSVPWRETPDLIIGMVTDYTDPADRSGTTLSFQDLNVSPIRRPLLSWVWPRARRFRLHREAVGSLYTYGYGLLRVCFLALADHFVRRGVFPSREDIFYLRLDEVRQIVAEEVPGREYADRIATRKCEISESQDMVLPSVVYGDQPVALETESSDRLQGTPTSRGCYTGPVRVIQGLREFGKLRDGDVLVIPYSDVGWTPLFGKAGAVIAESGGMLSHSSIIAREYGIPAVVSVAGACHLVDDTLVTVDGYRGEIRVQAFEEDSRARSDS